MTAATHPLVSIIVLSFNRRDQLRETLAQLKKQTYARLETIVVDNGSSDRSADMIRGEFPEVALLPLPRNIGIAGWNHGMQRAAGELLLVLDDDCYPAEDAIERAVAGMKTRPAAGIGALRVLEGTERVDMTASLPAIAPTFYGCAAMIRKAVHEKIGGFEEFLLVYVHEIEYAMRARGAGFEIAYLEESVAYHRTGDSSRSPLQPSSLRRRIRYDTQNVPAVLLLHFPLHRVALRIPRILSGRIVSGARHGAFLPAALGALSFLRAIPRLLRKRSMLPDRIQREYGFGGFAGGFFFDAGSYGLSRPRVLKFIPSLRH